MKNPQPRVQNILLAVAMALPLMAMGGAARADEAGADAGRPPMMQGGPDGAPGDADKGDFQGGPGPRGPGPRQDGGPEQGRGGPDHDGPNGPEHGPGQPPFGGPGFGGPHGPGFGGPGGPGFGGGRPPFFHGVELSPEQEDKVFAILHAEAPYLRDQAKAAAKAHEALRALAGAEKYDDAKAASLAKEAATAQANIELQHVRTEQKLLAVLTPEQRKKQQEKKDKKDDKKEDKGGRPQRP